MIHIEPTTTEFVCIHHEAWDLQWNIQFPEMIVTNNAVVRLFKELKVDWLQTDEDSWAHEWRPDKRYVARMQPMVARDEFGKPIYELITGLAYRAEISGGDRQVNLTLTLTNECERVLQGVLCEGGCLRAPAKSFRDIGKDHQGQIDSAVARSHVSVGDRMVGMAKLHRTGTTCCAYQHDPQGYEHHIERKCENMWGRSRDRIDTPAILGMVSVDGSKAYVLGYEGSASGLANAGSNHCLHSRPEYGDLAPAQSVTRKGHILFGDDIQVLAAQLREILGGPVGDKDA